MLKNKISLIIVIFMLLTSLTSCGSYRDINDLGIVLTTGLDYENGKIIVTNEIMTPEPKDSGAVNQEKPTYIQSSGDTILEALRNATLTFDKKLYLAHNRVIIIGEDFARRGFGDYINFYLYDSEPRTGAYLLIAKGAKAYEVLGINGGQSNSPGEYIEGLIINFSNTSKTRSLTMNEYFKYYSERGTPVIGVASIDEKMEISKQEGGGPSKNLVLDVTGGAVFKKDKLIDYYTGDDMIGFNFLVDEMKGGIIVFEVPDEYSKGVKYIGSKGKYTSLEIKESKTKNKVSISDGKINLEVNVKLKGSIGEDTKGLDIKELEVKNAIEEACSKRVEEYIRETLVKAQKKFQLDTFGIDRLVHKKYPNLWEEIADEWDDIFPKISYDIKVETNILRTGLIDLPMNIKMDDK